MNLIKIEICFLLFSNSGLIYNGKVFTCKTIPKYNGKQIVLKDILQNDEVSEEFFIKDKDLKKIQKQ